MQLATSDNTELQHVCTEHFPCFLANMLDIGNIFKTTSIKFQKEKLTIGECTVRMNSWGSILNPPTEQHS